MTPQFSKQSSRPLSPRAISASVRRGRQLLDLIDRYSTPQDMREKQKLSRAICNLSYFARELSRRHRGVSVAQDLQEPAAVALGRKGGEAGVGESQRRGGSDYYRQLVEKRWAKKQAQPNARPEESD